MSHSDIRCYKGGKLDTGDMGTLLLYLHLFCKSKILTLFKKNEDKPEYNIFMCPLAKLPSLIIIIKSPIDTHTIL